MDVVFDMATIAVIGFTVVLAAGALLRKDPRLHGRMFFGLVGTLAVVGLLQLVPAPGVAAGNDPNPAANGAASTAPTTPVAPSTSAPTRTDELVPSPTATAPLTVSDFLASGDLATPSRAAPSGGADRSAPLVVRNVCGPAMEWAFKLARKYRTIEVTVQLAGTADPVPAVTFQATADGQDIGTASVTTIGESETLTLTVADKQELVLRTSSTGAAECPDLLARWTDLRIRSS